MITTNMILKQICIYILKPVKIATTAVGGDQIYMMGVKLHKKR